MDQLPSNPQFVPLSMPPRNTTPFDQSHGNTRFQQHNVSCNRPVVGNIIVHHSGSTEEVERGVAIPMSAPYLEWRSWRSTCHWPRAAFVVHKSPSLQILPLELTYWRNRSLSWCSVMGVCTEIIRPECVTTRDVPQTAPDERLDTPARHPFGKDRIYETSKSIRASTHKTNVSRVSQIRLHWP